MFTGIVEEIGTVEALRRGARSARLSIHTSVVHEGTRVGDSIAINGTCLTAVECEGPVLSFDAVPETIERSSLRVLRVGDGVNLERALAVGQRLGGHFVQGHVDGTGTLMAVTEVENAHVLRISVGPDLLRYLVPKGSVAVDGISLTVASVDASSFTVWIIPHTFTHTILARRRIGDPLNIENDMLAKYVERLTCGGGARSGLSRDTLQAAGFVGADD